MNFLRKTLSDQQQTSALHLHLNAPTPTPKLSSSSSPLPPPRARGEEETGGGGGGTGSGGGGGGGGEVFWVCYGGRKAKMGIEAGKDVNDLRGMVCRMFLLENPALFDVVQVTILILLFFSFFSFFSQKKKKNSQIPEFLDPATPVERLSKTSMLFLVHANTRAIHGDEVFIHR